MGRAYAEAPVSRQSRTSRDITFPAWICRDPGTRISGDRIWRRRSRTSEFDDRAWTAVRRPPPLALGADVRRRSTDRCCTAAGSPRAGAAPAGRRWFLELDGIFYYGDVWFDGEYLGATEGYFAPHTFEVTRSAARARANTCSRSRSRARRNATAPRSARSPAATGTAPRLDPALNPGGIWRPVRLVDDRPGPHLDAARAVHRGARRARPARRATSRSTPDEIRSTRVLHAVVRRTRTARCCSTRDATGHARGGDERARRGCSTVDDPPRWWPQALGPQPLCTVRARRRGRRRRQRRAHAAHGVPRRAATTTGSSPSTASACS